jgi:hypothetical protein
MGERLALVQHQLLTQTTRPAITGEPAGGLAFFGLQARWLSGLAGLLIQLPLRSQDAAPVSMLGNGHAAFHTDAHPLTGLTFSRKQFPEGHPKLLVNGLSVSDGKQVVKVCCFLNVAWISALRQTFW